MKLRAHGPEPQPEEFAGVVAGVVAGLREQRASPASTTAATAACAAGGSVRCLATPRGDQAIPVGSAA